MVEKRSQNLFNDPSKVDMQKASVRLSQSIVYYDEPSQTFYATLDRLCFQSGIEIIQTVLEAQGFSQNFENMISCLETLHIGVYSESAKIQPNQDISKIKQYNHVLSFKTPSKSRSGSLISEFYEEIQKYEFELQTLREQVDKGNKNPKDKNELKAEGTLSELSKENAYLHSEIKKLRKQVNELQREEIHSGSQAGDDVPDGVRVASVSSISRKQRVVTMKSDRQSLNVPFQAFDVLPTHGDECLVWVDGHNTYHAITLVPNKAKIVDKYIADVLSREGEQIKIRLPHREELVLQFDEKLLQGCQRGSQVIVFFRGDILYRLDTLTDAQSGEPLEIILSEMITEQLNSDSSRNNFNHNKKQKKEAA